MAAPVTPDPAIGSAGEEQPKAISDASGGAPEPSPERPPTAPEGVAVKRYGNAELLELLHNDPVTIVLQPGEILFKEGDPGTTMYVVRSGVLRIRSGSVVYEDVAAGGIVGEMGLVEKHMPRSATIYALQTAEMIEIDEARFGQLVERRPSFAITVMRVLSRRLRYMDRRYRLEGMS
jgi:CRP-like cAMP-binding protein